MNQQNRRHFLYASAALTAAAVTPALAQQNRGGSMAQSAASLHLTSPGHRQGKYLDLDGARIFYQTLGQGAPMLLVHGYPLSGALFSRVAQPLSRRHMVITPDLRGYGQSKTQSEPDSVETYADDMLALMDKLNIKQATIGGMSMGGPTVLAMYKKAPDRFSGLILIDTAAQKASPAEAGLWNGMADWVQSKGVEPIIPFLLPQMLTGKTRESQPAQTAYLKEIMMRCSKQAAIGGAKALADRPDATGLLSNIKVPTLILVGLDDPLYSFEVAQKMQQAINGSRLHIVPGAAHAAIFENADNAGQAIAEWAGNAATTVAKR